MKGGVLAIDHGTKRCGFAVADPLRITTQALEPWRGPRAPGGPDHEAELLKHIAALLDERDVRTFLVGLPLHMDGTSGARANEVLAFVERLKQRFPRVAVVTWDERLTTKAAEDLLRESGHRGADARVRRDSWSALVLLRDWIESGEPG